MDNPINYGTKQSEKDKRTLIPQNGAKAMWIKATKVNDRLVFIVAYQNGRGGVVIGISTCHDCFEWDAVLKTLETSNGTMVFAMER